MKAPRRLVDGPLSPDKRRVLEASLASGPSSAARERIWAGLSPHLLQLGSAATTLAAAEKVSAATKLAAGASGGAKLALVSAAAPSITKVLLAVVVAASGATVAGSLLLRQQHENGVPEARPTTAVSAPLVTPAGPPPPQAPARQAALHARQTPADIEVDPLPQRPSRVPTSPKPAEREEPTTPAGRLAAESALVAEARDKLRAGQLGSCLALLQELDRKFPGGVLAQERSVLKIEGLTQVGQPEYARELAQEFSRRYPESPHLSKVRELVGEQVPGPTWHTEAHE